MKNRSGEKIKLASIDELLGVVNEESAMEIEISKIHPFKNHPFKVLDDEKMQDLVESVKINGILTPVLLRMDENEEYEMVSGHRRMHAAQLAGLTTIPAIVRELSDDAAIVAMVDANMVSLTGLICGILMLLTGMGYWSIITGAVFGVLADLVLKSGDYKSAKKGIISHGVFSMWIIGNYIPIVATRDSYYQQLISGYGQEYADSIMSYISAYTLPLLLIAGFVCGVIGGVIGQKIFKKHFKRAGIA